MTAESSGCPQCTDTSPAQAYARAVKVPIRHRMVGESHLGAGLRRCAACGQEYLFVFAEVTDWPGADDPQTFLFVPVTAAESEWLAGIGEDDLPAALKRLPSRRHLRHTSGFDAAGPESSWLQIPIMMPPYT
jgi:hypothetical protein